MKTMRIECWFTNGLFRAFPEVDPESLEEKEVEEKEVIAFIFKGGHIANINKNNVNFIEIMEEQ